MLRKATRLLDANGNEIDPGAIYVSVDGFASAHPDVPRVPIVAVRGARLRGDSPAVRACPGFWLPDGADDQTLAEARFRIWPDAA